MTRPRKILVTGGAGFIGSAVVRHFVSNGHEVINVDKLTYSGNLESVREVATSPNYRFHRADICDQAAIAAILSAERPDAIMNLAAETHVDRSIDGPSDFLEANVVGTFRLLNAALEYWHGLDGADRSQFRFHQVSTDEVFGDLPFDGGKFSETTAYAPSSPYSASKAAADHFVRAWNSTYDLPVVLSNCSNNYGSHQYPEKLIPLTILNAIEGRPLSVYGQGANVRDWLYVDDHARALELILAKGAIGESYNVGGGAERTNLEVVEAICDLVDERVARLASGSRRDLIRFVADRPGHDRRYAIDTGKVERDLGWRAQEDFDSGLAKTVDWYIANDRWWRPIRELHYGGSRLGIKR
ncbi:MAG: dTDP-glucose 4,6-dehydratase [Pseudomonadota bacterium]